MIEYGKRGMTNLRLLFRHREPAAGDGAGVQPNAQTRSETPETRYFPPVSGSKLPHHRGLATLPDAANSS